MNQLSIWGETAKSVKFHFNAISVFTDSNGTTGIDYIDATGLEQNIQFHHTEIKYIQASPTSLSIVNPIYPVK